MVLAPSASIPSIIVNWYFPMKWRGPRRLTGLESNNLFTETEGFNKIPNRKSYSKINENYYKRLKREKDEENQKTGRLKNTYQLLDIGGRVIK